MFSEAKSKVDLEIAFVELESAFALFAMSVLMGIWVRSPVFNLSCDRSFSDISADGVLSAIALFRM